ncbi:MAG: RluA family pseudouridine synthase, partial [Pseudomonadota bacterium]
PISRLCLHARELDFNHPISGERLNFYCPAEF